MRRLIRTSVSKQVMQKQLADIVQEIRELQKTEANNIQTPQVSSEDIQAKMDKWMEELKNFKSQQTFTSKETSINKEKNPRMFNVIKSRGGFFGDNFDNGGGRYDTVIKWFKDNYGDNGFSDYIFDPFNRDLEYNTKSYCRDDYDTSTIANVLNVIDNDDEIKKVLQRSKDRANIVYIDVYEGDTKNKRNEGRQTGTDQYQRNGKPEDYLEYVDAIFGKGNYSLKQGIITAWTPEKLQKKYGDEGAEQIISVLKGKTYNNPRNDYDKLIENSKQLKQSKKTNITNITDIMPSKSLQDIKQEIKDEVVEVKLGKNIILNKLKAIFAKTSKKTMKDIIDDLDFSDADLTLYTNNGSKIQRSKKYGVGKEIGNQIYVHKKYANKVVPADILQRAQGLFDTQFPNATYNCVMYEPNTKIVRFDEAPDFDSAREPHVGTMYKIYPDSDEITTSNSNNIWHHKWLWVLDDYAGFNTEESKKWSAKWLGILPQTAKGTDKTWNKQLEENGLQ